MSPARGPVYPDHCSRDFCYERCDSAVNEKRAHSGERMPRNFETASEMFT